VWARRLRGLQFVLRRITRWTHAEVWETQQSERASVPLGEEVVHLSVVLVIDHAVVREAGTARRARTLKVRRPPLCTMAEWRAVLYDIPTLSKGLFKLATASDSRHAFTGHRRVDAS
jgi:hypothetical protein